jgi:hypothetical protein
MRQGTPLAGYDPKPGVSISTLAYEYPVGFNVVEHAHGSDQLIYAPRGERFRRTMGAPPKKWSATYTAC